MVKVNDKIVLVNKMGMFDNIGDVYTVVHVDDDYVLCAIESSPHVIGVSHDELYEYFEPYKEEVECDYCIVDEILDECDIAKATAFGKCMIVSCKLPSGQVIVEHYDCCCPECYNETTAYEICLNNIISKIYELETYVDARIDMIIAEETEDEEEETDSDCTYIDGKDFIEDINNNKKFIYNEVDITKPRTATFTRYVDNDMIEKLFRFF